MKIVGSIADEGRDFNAEIKRILPPERFAALTQLEEMLELSRDATLQKDSDHYRNLLLDLEERAEGRHELHGFLRASVALMEAQAASMREPFRDEFLIREFAGLDPAVQAKILEDLWAEYPELAALLDRFSALGSPEKAAFVLWLTERERLSAP